MGGLRKLVAFGALAVLVSCATASLDLGALPRCSVPCFISGLPVSPCSPLDQDCLCQDTNYQVNVTDCVKQSCKVPEQLVVKNATSSSCGFPSNNHDVALVVVQSTLIPAVWIIVLCRVATKLLRLSSWGWDDYTILFGLALSIVFEVLGPMERQMGLGRDIWTLTPDQITASLKLFFIGEVTYTLDLCVIKTSYLLFFLRIFQASTIRKYIIGTIIFNVALGATFVIADLTQCMPVYRFWDQWDGAEHPGRCFNINAMAWSHAIINIVLDCWMMALPASQLVRLRLPTWKKVGVILMFSAGFILTVVSILRLRSLFLFAESLENITVDFFWIAVYSPVECCAGILCACLPAFSQLVQWVWMARPAWMRTTSSSTSFASGSILAIKTVGSKTVGRRLSEDRQELYFMEYGNTTSGVTVSGAAAPADGNVTRQVPPSSGSSGSTISVQQAGRASTSR